MFNKWERNFQRTELGVGEIFAQKFHLTLIPFLETLFFYHAATYKKYRVTQHTEFKSSIHTVT